MGIFDGIKNGVVNAAWHVKALADVASYDQDRNGKLSRKEFVALSQWGDDDWLSAHLSGYEQAAIAELDLDDGEISASELATFYQRVDANKNLSISSEDAPDHDRFLWNSSLKTKLRFPLAAMGNTLSQLGYAVDNLVNKHRND